jgi:acetyl-CoA carboxylase alpha subunit
MNMRNTYLDFEQPLGELEGKIEQLRYVQADSAVDISEEIGRLQQKSHTPTTCRLLEEWHALMARPAWC